LIHQARAINIDNICVGAEKKNIQDIKKSQVFTHTLVIAFKVWSLYRQKIAFEKPCGNQ
jgi:hypothetical protein